MTVAPVVFAALSMVAVLVGGVALYVHGRRTTRELEHQVPTAIAPVTPGVRRALRVHEVRHLFGDERAQAAKWALGAGNRADLWEGAGALCALFALGGWPVLLASGGGPVVVGVAAILTLAIAPCWLRAGRWHRERERRERVVLGERVATTRLEAYRAM